MKQFLLLISFFTIASVHAQTTMLVINNHPFHQSVDVKFVNISTMDVEGEVLELNYVACAIPLVLPSTTILNIEFYEAGTSDIINTVSNVVYNPNTIYIGMYHGSSGTNNQFSSNSAQTTATAGNFKAQARNSISGMQSVDFILRENGAVIGNDVTYPSISSGFAANTPTNDYILDITPAADNSYGLFAYDFNCSTCDQEYIYFFLSGSASDPDCYALHLDGSCTNLAHVAPFVGIEEADAQFELYPNPSEKEINIVTTTLVDQSAAITITDITGRAIAGNITREISGTQYTINIELLPVGFYTLTLQLADGTIATRRFSKI
ncbi:MAG: T9SS type A sorting domain-containing protein [Flavobacteriales bacterium]